MIDAKRRLADLKDRIVPDLQGRGEAARELVREFGQIASELGYEVEATQPDKLVVSLANYPLRVSVAALDGVVMAAGERELRKAVEGLKYEPIDRKFSALRKEPTPGVDVLAEHVAQLFEAEIRRRTPKPAPDPFEEADEEV